MEVTPIRLSLAKKIFLLMQGLVLIFGLAVAVQVVIAYSEDPNITITGNSVPGDNTFSIRADNTTSQSGLIAIGAGLALGLSGAGAGLGLGTAASSASAAITEKPEAFGKLLVFLALIEAIAIYGFVIAFVLTGSM